MPSPRRLTWTNKDGGTSTAWQVRYKDRKGARRSKQFLKKKDAETFAATVTSEVRAGTHVHDRDTITVAEAAQRWLDAVKRGRNGRDPVEPHTLRVYDLFVRTHIDPFIGLVRLNRLTPARVREFRDIDLLGNGRSRSMTKKVLGALSSICREAVSDELLGVNPCSSISIVTASRHKEAIRIPTKAEVRIIVDRAADWIERQPRAMANRGGELVPVQARISRHRALWWYTMLRFIISTGVRLSEARGAKRSALDLKTGMFRVTQRADERNRIGATKSGAARRDLEIGAGLAADLKRWLVVAAKCDLVFPSGTGKPELAQNIYRRFWLPLLVECGLATRVQGEDGAWRHDTEFSIHDLRHFHASLMIEAGMQAKQLQEHMGHSSIKITMDTYGHLFNDEGAKARRRQIVVHAIDGLLEG